MIFTLVQSINREPIAMFHNNIESWKLFELLNNAFPNSYNFAICCASGYENGIVFSDFTFGNAV
jgi:hypothetical protein